MATILIKVILALILIIILLIPVKKIEKEVNKIEFNDPIKSNIYKQIYLLYGIYIFAEFVILAVLLLL